MTSDQPKITVQKMETINVADINKAIQRNRDHYFRIPLPKREVCLEKVRKLYNKENPAVGRQIREAFVRNPSDWYTAYHFGWGMGFRNWLRDNGFGEKYWPIGNLDDIYVFIVEEALCTAPNATNTSSSATAPTKRQGWLSSLRARILRRATAKNA